MALELQYAAIAAFAALVASWNVGSMLRARKHDRARWVWALCLYAGAIGFLARIPAIYRRLDSLSSVPNLSTLLVDISFILCAALILLWIIYWPNVPVDGTDRSVMVIAAGVVATLAVLFFLAPAAAERLADFQVAYSHNPVISAYDAVYVAAFTCTWPVAAVSCRRARKVARRSGYRWLVYGLRFVEVGMWMALVYAFALDSVVVGAWLGTGVFDRWSTPAGNLFASLSATSSCIGSTCWSWGPKLERHVARCQLDARRSFRRQEPLWHLVAPYDHLSPTPDGVQLTGLRRSRQAAGLRTVSILDRVEALAARRDTQVARAAMAGAETLGLTGMEALAFAEASVLTAAVAAAEDLPEARRHPVPVFSGLAEATQWQVIVATALDRIAGSPSAHQAPPTPASAAQPAR